MTRVVICCGSGGVGKTTTSAALALRAALGGARVAVVTIDPARRLADTLALHDVGNVARTVALEGLPPGARLDALMLDAKRTFDDIVRRFAATDDARDRILGNHYYRYVSTRLAGAHEYMAMEKLLELVSSEAYDVVVLDTPPSRHALDFLAAPDRMANLMDEGVMRWLALPASRGGWKMIERGSELLARVLRSMLGDRTIGEIAEFFLAFQTLWDGFRERSSRVRALLGAPHTRFVLVTSPAPAARAEALDFVDVLVARGMPFGGFVINRCTEGPDLGEPAPSFGPPASGVDPAAWAAAIDATMEVWRRRAAQTDAQRRAIRELLEHAGTARAWRIAERDDQVQDVVALRSLAEELPSVDEVFATPDRPTRG